MKWLLIIPGLLLALIATLALVGACLPRRHVATRTVVLRYLPTDVYAAIRDFARMPLWRRGITSVEILPPQPDRIRYREISRHHAITYVLLADLPEKQVITQIADKDLPYSGTWTFDLSASARGTTLQITEHGEVKNVLFRFLSRFVFGHTHTIDHYLIDLQNHLRASVGPGPAAPAP